MAYYEKKLGHLLAFLRERNVTTPASITPDVIRRYLVNLANAYNANACELERVPINHAVLCWVRMQMAEHRYENWLHEGGTPDRMRRPLSMPTVQVNIAQQQVNVAGW
jgi:hypothetical protein